MDHENFFPPQNPVATSLGPCNLPIHYHDGSLVALFWRVDRGVAAATLQDTPFEPMTFFGQALALLVAFEYRDTTIGPYNEVGLAIWARLRGSKPSALKVLANPRLQPEQGVVILNLPVTTEAAWTAGREIWGYPKYVSPIRTAFGDDQAETVLEGEFRLRVKRRSGLLTRGIPFVILSALKGRILRTIVEVAHQVRWSLGGAKLELLGGGPTAGSIRALGLDRTRPALVFRTDRMRSFLPLGKDQGPVQGA